MPSPTWPPSGAGRSSADAPPHPVPAVKVERKIQVAATPTEAFAKLSDVKVLASLLTGLMDWTATDEPNRFRTVFRAGPAPLGGEIELDVWPEAAAGARYRGGGGMIARRLPRPWTRGTRPCHPGIPWPPLPAISGNPPVRSRELSNLVPVVSHPVYCTVTH